MEYIHKWIWLYFSFKYVFTANRKPKIKREISEFKIHCVSTSKLKM